MTLKIRNLRRPLYVAAALVLAVGALVPVLGGYASAAQVTTRSIKLSSSTAGATNTTYTVAFNPGTTGTIGGIIVDFCANTPIIGDTSCTLPTSFNLGGASPTVSGYSGMGTGWAAAGTQGGAAGGQSQVLRLTNVTPQSVATATPVSFDITTVTNPNADNTSFYARILTFDTSANSASQYTVSTTTRAATFANMVDYGGVAMSTGKVINITAKVMESLSFCVYKTTCSDDPSFTIGHGANLILDTTAVDTQDAIFSVSTNAQGTTTVRLKGDTLKAGLNDINAVGASAAAITAGVENFGVRVQTLGSGATAAAPYLTGSNYALDTTSTTSTYGDDIATLSGPANASATTIRYGATAGNTTAAGIYTATHQLIATASF